MVDNLRRGGFGSPSLTGPFGTNTGGFGQYAIGGTGEDAAYLDKLEAQIAWQNGRLSDEAYLAALRKYVKSTEKGTTTYVRAVDELADTEQSIRRNDAVLAVNNATSPQARINALIRLRSVDQAALRTMRPGNEAYEEQQARIADLDVQIRSTQWGEVVRRFNAGKLSNADMAAQAARFAGMARGSADEQEYLDQVTDFRERIDDEKLGEAMEAWNDDQTSGNAAAVRAIYARISSGLAPDSPRGKAAAQGLENFNEAVKAHEDALAYERMSSRRANGGVSDEAWLDFLRKRMNSEDRGSIEYIRRRDQFVSETFNTTEQTLRLAVADGSRSPQDLIDFYQSSLATMDLDSSRAIGIQQEIADLRATGLEALEIGLPEGWGGYEDQPFGGHLVYPKGQGLGTGFVSQFDESYFAQENCGMASAAMLAWAVTDGKIRVNGGQMRYYSGDTDEGGTWVDDMVTAMGVIGVGAQAFTGMDFGDWRQKIKSGQPCVLTGTSGMLPEAYNPSGYQGSHSVYVDRMQVMRDGSVWYYVMDPLGRSAKEGGMWWPEQAIIAFSWQGTAQGTPGSAVFAGKAGDQRNVSGVLPPFQAFDTDWLGNSTVGRGGGTSRSEAGARRDWSEGRPAAPRNDERKGTDDEMVADFLAAVETIEKRGPVSVATEASLESAAVITERLSGREERLAREILERNGGDPRLAAIEWFGGETPGTDPREWTQIDRWRANAVGRQFGYEKVTRTTQLVSPKELPPTDPATEPTTTGRSAENPEQPTGLPADLDAMARGIVERLGLRATPERVRAMAAWITAENGGKDVQGYNPLRLMTMGETHFDGQLGKFEDGSANFGSLEAGLEATADQIKAENPALVGALRTGNVETFMRTLASSGWSEREDYANAVSRAYNTLPGTTPLIVNTGPRPFEVPTDLGGAASRTPELAELFDVDPLDPNQRAWFDGNVQRAKDAALIGAETWVYETPDGREITVETTAGIARDVLGLDYQYKAAAEPPTQEGHANVAKAYQDYMSLSTEIDFESGARFMESSVRARNEAIARGDLTTAWNIEQTMRQVVNGLTGNAPYDTPDAASMNNPYLTPTQRNAVARWVESLEPREAGNTGGSELASMERDGLLVVENFYGAPAGGALGPPGPTGAQRVTLATDAFATVEPDGTVSFHHQGNDPDAFAPVTEVDPITGEKVVIPKYRSAVQSGHVHVVTGGWDVYQPIEQLKEGFVQFYARDYSGPSAQLEQRQQQSGDRGAIAPFLDALGAGIAAVGYQFGAGQPQSSIVTEAAGVATKPDPTAGILRSVGTLDPAQIPVGRISYPDPETGETVTWISLDRFTWVGWVGDRFGGKPPGLVLNADSGASWRTDEKGNTQLLINGQPYDGKRPINELLHWYGTQRGDIAGGEPRSSVGAPGGDYLVRHTGLATDGSRLEGEVFDGALTARDRLRTGLLTPAEGALRLREEVIAGREGGMMLDIPAATDMIAGRAVGTTPRSQLVTPPWQLRTTARLDPRLSASVSTQAAAAATERAAAYASIARTTQQAIADREAQVQAQEQQVQLRKTITPVAPEVKGAVPSPRIEDIVTPKPAPTPKGPPVQPKYNPLPVNPPPPASSTPTTGSTGATTRQV